MKEETPYEKAKRLKVGLFKKIPELPKLDQTSKDVVVKTKTLHDLMNEVIGVCEGCSKEITRGMSKHPCGRGDCPFGALSN